MAKRPRLWQKDMETLHTKKYVTIDYEIANKIISYMAYLIQTSTQRWCILSLLKFDY